MSTNINENINIIEYILALATKTQTKEQIDSIRGSIKTLDDSMYLLNSILEVEKHKIDNNVNDELKFIKDQYKALGCNYYFNFKFISSLIELYLYKHDIGNPLSVENKISMLYNIINEIEECKNSKVKNNVYTICLRYITEHKLITIDKDLTVKVLIYCKALSEEEKYLTLLPDELLGL